ncbi:hypothetical protein [Methylobacterium sp. SyP6R]|uniref:hypothetical protein n=1 Tax=Methylobacterium sp. SyP6R TaxID=2718876 RepID=UPI001F287CD1|nr:hypothetical protein [Methylobacterium sp. SyP6R]MCF4128701.1 hypothetical protein [Methylobacterium sp. SyP6R]
MRLPLIALALSGIALAGPASAQMPGWTPPEGFRHGDFHGFHGGFRHWHGRPHRSGFRSFDLNSGAVDGPAVAPEPPGLAGVSPPGPAGGSPPGLAGAVPPGLANGSGNGNGNVGNFNGNGNTGNNNGNGNVGNGLGNGFSTNGNGNGIGQ